MGGRVLTVASLLLAACGTNPRESTKFPLASAEPPPAPNAEIPGPPPEPGQVWVDGRWARTEAGWEWKSGEYLTPPRLGALWVPGRWIEQEGRWIWTVGDWR